jgi:hypothetical protein
VQPAPATGKRRRWDRRQLVIIAVSLLILGLFLLSELAPLIQQR